MSVTSVSGKPLSAITIADIMKTRVASVHMDDRLSVIKKIFAQVQFHHLLVVEDKQLVGILSERDMLRTISPNLGKINETVKDLDTLNKRVHQIMVRNPISVSPTASLDEASNLLLNNKISCLPVVNDKTLLGIITWKDILKAYCRFNEKS
jgi:acetoin utilization protein AcuB